MTERPRVALTMIVRDGAATLARCLNSVRGVVDEMIVVDTGSTDDSGEIAATLGAHVFAYHWRDDFAAARNEALRYSSAGWNLVLDHDEYLVGNAESALEAAIAAGPAIGRITVVSAFEQDGQIKSSRDLLSRLLPRGTYYQGRIHEQVVSDLPRRDTALVAHHDGYVRADKSERNLRLLHAALSEEGADLYLLYQTARQYRLARRYDEASPYYERAYALISRTENYAPNLIVDYLHNCLARNDFATALRVVYAEREYLAAFPDFHFVRGLLYMRQTPPGANALALIEEAFMTCLALGETDRYDSVVGAGSFLAAYNLGLLYELRGLTGQAITLYQRAAAEGYQPARDRLAALRSGA